MNMKNVYRMIKRVPSASHNAPCDEQGHYWPVGERFKLLSEAKQRYLRKTHQAGRTYFEQLGGEQVIISIPTDKIGEFLEKE